MANPGILAYIISCTYGQSRSSPTATITPFKTSLLLSASSCWVLLPLHPQVTSAQ